MEAQRPAAPGRRTADGVVLRRIWISGPLAIVGAVLANLIVLPLVLLLPGASSSLAPFQIGAIVMFTAFEVGLGVIVFALIARFTQHPIRIFTIVALIVLVLSGIPNLLYALNPAASGLPGATGPAFLDLYIFHIVAAAVTITLLTRVSRE